MQVQTESPFARVIQDHLELKERNALTWLVDRLFVRREVAASLRRTLARFARERRADLELEGEASR